MLQHDDIHPVDCFYMDGQGDTVHLQVPLGECSFCEISDLDIASQIWVDFYGEHKQPSLHQQICPYNAIKFLPRERHIAEDTSRQLKHLVGKDFIKSTL